MLDVAGGQYNGGLAWCSLQSGCQRLHGFLLVVCLAVSCPSTAVGWPHQAGRVKLGHSGFMPAIPSPMPSLAISDNEAALVFWPSCRPPARRTRGKFRGSGAKYALTIIGKTHRREMEETEPSYLKGYIQLGRQYLANGSMW